MASHNISVNTAPEKEEEEDCTTWVRPPDAGKKLEAVFEKQPLLPSQDTEPGPTEEPTDKRGLFMSLFILILSVPALIGAWCWPALVIGLLSGVASAAARQLGHLVSIIITGTLMIGVNSYIFYKCRQRKGTFRKRWGPLCFTLVAAPLILLDILRHVLADNHIWKAGPFPGSSEYRHGCTQENWSCLTLTGWLITIGCTYIGFACLFVGTMWSANLIQKLKQIRKKWLELRAASKK